MSHLHGWIFKNPSSRKKTTFIANHEMKEKTIKKFGSSEEFVGSLIAI